MLKIQKFITRDFLQIHDLLNKNIQDYIYFKKLGWNLDQFEKQFSKNIFYGHGLYINNTLKGFIFGDLISFKNIIDYEILLIYISIENRKLGYATKLFRNIQLALKKLKLHKIYLEVAADNVKAINFYKKNGFKKVGLREKYYNLDHDKLDAYLFEKEMNE